MAEQIKVGFCVAYDWPMLQYALPPIYNHADVIYISLDVERKTWTGKSYTFDANAFQQLLEKIDVNNKINIYEDNFHLPELSAGQNEVRQRNKLAEQMGVGGWHIQLDCDEYFMEFEKLVQYLHSQNQADKRFNVCCPLITLFKETNGGYLYVQPDTQEQLEYIQIATLTPQYTYGRRNGNFNVYTNFLIVHQSWARSEAEIQQKISNWGHINDFNQESFLRNWVGLNKENFTSWKNFHPIAPNVWPRLAWQAGQTVEALIHNFDTSKFPQLNTWQLILKNSKWLSRIRALIKRLGLNKQP